MEVIEVQHPWDQHEEDVFSDELDDSLITRKKIINQIPLPTTRNGEFTTQNGVTNGQEQEQEPEKEHEHEEEQEQEPKQEQVKEQEHEDEEEEVKDYDEQNGIKVDEDVKEEQKQEKPEYSVYYDKNKGIDVVEADGVDLATNGKGPVLENTDTAIHNRENGNGVHSAISNQNGKHQKDDNFPEIASLEQVDKSSPSPIKNKSEISEVIEEGDDEIAEFDVETVLKKQGTHDLFCPNCNSCITKRVILRKRKRRIPVPGEDSKRNKPENPPPSEVNVASSNSGDNQAQYVVEPKIDEAQPLISNEYDHQREPDVFRCLSCFSIFMPTGNGFKLFGNKNNEQNNQPSQKEVPVKRHWFSKFFAFDKVKQGAVQSIDATKNIPGVSTVSSNLNTPRQGANIPATNGEITTNTPVVADTNEQLLTSYKTEESNDKSNYPGMFVVRPPSDNVEAAENSVSPLINDGLKLVIPPNVGSLIIDNSQMNQELDVTVQTNNPDINEKGSTDLSFSPPDPTLGHLNLDGQKNNLGLPTNLAINEKEQKMYKNNDIIVPEVSPPRTVQNNVEIHLEEPLKVDNDVLTDRQINLIEDLKDIERITGKDTIVNIDNIQPEASACETSPDVTGVTGTPVLQQAVAQGGVTTATGGGRSLDIVKSIVYGGLMEVIVSLSVVGSAVGAKAATLNVLALGLANIFGGLFVIGHDLWDLKNDRTRKKEDRYQQLLGQRADFPLHVAISLLSYLIFGFVPPVVYGFSFRESNDKDFKLLTVAAASILCIMILAAGKAYIQCPRKSYLKTIAYYVVFGVMTSGASYLFGGLIMKLLEKIDVFHSGSMENLIIPGVGSKPALAAY